MSQNIYDTATFFEGYSSLPRSQQGLPGMPEWPALQAMLPPLAGLNILDLASGFGWFSRYASSQNAKAVLGLEISSNMMARAASFPADDKITYKQANLEKLDLDGVQVDLAVCVLGLHYIVDLQNVVAQVFRALKAGGTFAVEVEHPIFTAPTHQDFTDVPLSTAKTIKVWPLYDYFREGPRVTRWLANDVVKQHRSVTSYLNIFLGAGFVLDRFFEWRPTEESLKSGLASERGFDRPVFLLMRFSKPE
ncbi:ubie coq5 [Phlyctema vagabunda]|uniref:Ubie coq5 n=1 Tax=Phlyctema vagabunda TaxID=108571 RepID=A0ABR4P881_9HELO